MTVLLLRLCRGHVIIDYKVNEKGSRRNEPSGNDIVLILWRSRLFLDRSATDANVMDFVFVLIHNWMNNHDINKRTVYAFYSEFSLTAEFQN